MDAAQAAIKLIVKTEKSSQPRVLGRAMAVLKVQTPLKPLTPAYSRQDARHHDLVNAVAVHVHHLELVAVPVDAVGAFRNAAQHDH